MRYLLAILLLSLLYSSCKIQLSKDESAVLHTVAPGASANTGFDKDATFPPLETDFIRACLADDKVLKLTPEETNDLIARMHNAGSARPWKKSPSKKIPLLKLNKSQIQDFLENHLNYTLISISRPVFFKNNRYCIIYGSSGSCFMNEPNGYQDWYNHSELAVYERKGNKWVKVSTLFRSVS